LDVRDLAGRFKPRVRCEAPAQQQQWFILQVSDLEQWTPAQRVALRQHGQEEHWIECASFRARVASWHNGDFDVATIEQVPKLTPARFLQLNFHERMATVILGKEVRQKTLNHLRRSTYAKQTGLPRL
jgi:hypothetical protein